uniref:Uncharacterized protein n=1 Tax=Alexandrium catenella TaxID=2925 RepID=A0A7S1WJH8_ALECA|mmetsp:Transcript_66852/g.178052  ORF Transcript_66852/g.178052 Transcript_66852/m.178052 type:complete len:104 (+) Transcript_66852:1-312(+)
MPTYKNPFIHGNLFLMLTIKFPESLSVDNQAAMRKLLPPPLHVPAVKETDEGVEVHTVVDIDPVHSHDANKVNMMTGGEAYDEDEEGGGGMGGGPGGAQCKQM